MAQMKNGLGPQNGQALVHCLLLQWVQGQVGRKQNILPSPILRFSYLKPLKYKKLCSCQIETGSGFF
jgi:hypothetical protein